MKNIKVKWTGGIEINTEDIRLIEKIFNISYPIEFIDIIKFYDGGRMDFELTDGKSLSGVIDIPNWGYTAFILFRHYTENYEEIAEILNIFNITREELPNLFIPFARDGGGNYFIFDFEEDSKNPKIYFQNHEEAVTIDDLEEEELDIMTLEEYQKGELLFVANSFKEFIEKVVPREI